MIRTRGAQIMPGEVIEAGEVYCEVVRDVESWWVADRDLRISKGNWPHFRDATPAPSLSGPGVEAAVGELRAENERLRALLDRNDALYCRCSRADVANKRWHAHCPHHGVGLSGQLREARAAVTDLRERIATAIEAEWTPEWERLREKNLGQGVPMLGRFLADKVRARIARSES